jgi:hypothetical protein
MSERDSHGRLADLAAATEALKPDASLTDDVLLAAFAESTRELSPAAALDEEVMLAAELDEHGRATSELEPSARFVDAVIEAVSREPGAVVDSGTKAAPSSRSRIAPLSFIRSGRAALVAAASIAAGTILYAVHVEQAFDADVMASVDSVEAGE